MPMPIIATIAYVLSPDRTHVLLIHRNKRPDDIHYGRHLGLGGRVERDEDVVTGARREIQEESGLTAVDVVLRGTIHWPGFGGADQTGTAGKGGDGWFGFVFRVDTYTGDAHAGNDEGTLAWVPVDRLADVPMWESDHLWLPMVFDADPRQFHGVMPYHEGEMVNWNYLRL